jgi:hypothetical protein
VRHEKTRNEKKMKKDIVSATPGGDLIQWDDWKKKLFVVEPLELEKDVKTQHGVTDAIRANVFVLTGPESHEEFLDTLIFPRVLVSQLKKGVGSYVIGRLTQGEAQRGKNPPWLLADATEDDMAKARNFLAREATASASAPDTGDEWDSGAGEDEPAF